MNKLTTQDLHFILSRLPKDIRKMMQAKTLFLAGGFIRSIIAGERVSDIDMFGPDEATIKEVALELTNGRNGRMHTTQNAYTILSSGRSAIQIIRRWTYKFPDELIEEFDFTIVQAVIWWQPSLTPPENPETTDDKPKGEWLSICADRFYSDLAARRLHYTAPHRHEDAGGSLLRVRKYLSRGYSIQAPSLAAVVARIVSGIDPEKQDIQDEEGTTIIITGLLREVDPMLVVDGLDIIDEHEQN